MTAEWTPDGHEIVRAVVFDGTPGHLMLRSYPRPVPALGEVLVNVVGCTLCGSDLHTTEGRRQVAVPTVLGHEIVGEIAAWGQDGPAPVDVEGHSLSVGDRVVWAVVASCGKCLHCQRGIPQKCHRAIKYGHERAEERRTLTGGLADACLLAPGTAIVRVPASMPLEVACPASCATATVAAALEPAGDLTGRTVAVFGLGLLGLTACAMARVAGAATVLGIDPSPQRRERATAFGATALESSRDFARESQPKQPDIDVSIEVSGSPIAVAEAVRRATIGGAIHLVGSVAPVGTVPVDPEHIVRRLLTIRGIHNYAPCHLVNAVRFLAEHGSRFPFTSLIERWYPLSETPEAFAAAVRSRAVRVGVRP